MIIFAINWYVILSVVGILLILLRDDKEAIFYDIKKGYNKKTYIAILHTVALVAIMPVTIPFSLYRIFKKWL